MEYSYQITGMHCASCVEKIKTVLSSQYHVTDVALNPSVLRIEANEAPNLNALNKQIATAGNYSVTPKLTVHTHHEESPDGLAVYFPILLIALYISGVALINNIHWSAIHWYGFMNQFMAGFFLVFSAFKFLDLRGFADGYATYDLLAKQWHFYGFIYPFLELSFGLLYLTGLFPTFTLIATIIVMSFSSLGVINSLRKKQQFQCACLGTLLKVPLSNVTLVEDLTMVALAAISLMM